TAGPLEGAADPGRHPQRRARRVHDRVDLEEADVPVPEFEARHPSPLVTSVRTVTGPDAAWYTRGRRRDMPVRTSQVLVLRTRATSAIGISATPWRPMRTN